MTKVNLKVKVPSVSRTQNFNLEVEVNSEGNLSITFPQQTVKDTGCYLPFSSVVENYSMRKVKRLSDIPNLRTAQATAESVTGRKLNLEFSPTEMQEALTLALTASYC